MKLTKHQTVTLAAGLELWDNLKLNEEGITDYERIRRLKTLEMDEAQLILDAVAIREEMTDEQRAPFS